MELFEAIWKSALLGTVQGLCEFLPVSSSGHLILLQRLLGYSLGGGSMTFVNLMLHFGTLIAVVWAFRRDILSLFRKPLRPLCYLLFATVPAAAAGLIFGDAVDGLYAGKYGMILLSVSFFATAVLLLAAEMRKRPAKKLGARQAAAMGLMQAVAILPGVSRSGSTIAAGVLAGASAEESSRFSFLMSIPVIAGGVLLGLFGAARENVGIDAAGAAGMAVGILFSAAGGLFAIRVMMRAVKRANYKWFAVYLIALSFGGLWLFRLGVV